MNNWITKQSEHYIFHYHKNSIAENMIDDIVEEQEYCFNHISRVLNIDFNIKINYYLCNSSQEVGALYGDNEPCNAFARKPNNIFNVFGIDVNEFECRFIKYIKSLKTNKDLFDLLEMLM